MLDELVLPLLASLDVDVDVLDDASLLLVPASLLASLFLVLLEEE